MQRVITARVPVTGLRLKMEFFLMVMRLHPPGEEVVEYAERLMEIGAGRIQGITSKMRGTRTPARGSACHDDLSSYEVPVAVRLNAGRGAWTEAFQESLAQAALVKAGGRALTEQSPGCVRPEGAQ